MDNKADCESHTVLGNIASNENFERYRKEIRQSLETNPPRTLTQLREEDARKAQEQGGDGQEAKPLAANEESHRSAASKINLSDIPQRRDSPLAETARKQLLNPSIYAVNDPFVKHMVESTGKIRDHVKPCNLDSIPIEARLDCAIAWFGPHGQYWSEGAVEKLIKNRYKSGDKTANISISEVRLLRRWLTKSDVYLAGRGVEGAQLRWKAQTMSPDEIESWGFKTRKMVVEDKMGEEEEANIRRQRSDEWHKDLWRPGRRPVHAGPSAYGLVDMS